MHVLAVRFFTGQLRLYQSGGRENDWKTNTHTAGLYPGAHGWIFARQHMQQSLLFHWNAFEGK